MSFGDYKILVAGGKHAPEQVLCQADVMKQRKQWANGSAFNRRSMQ